MQIISNSIEKTHDIAFQLVRELSEMKQKNKNEAACIALVGDLGAGKTTFVQGIARALGLKERVLSPTFLIMKRFDIEEHNGEVGNVPFGAVYHFDFYRLTDHNEALEVGFEEVLQNKNHLVVIEWADKFKKIVPKNAVWVNLEWLGDGKRKISFV